MKRRIVVWIVVVITTLLLLLFEHLAGKAAGYVFLGWALGSVYVAFLILFQKDKEKK